ncbi:MAG TPA: hypothetical protein DD490_29840 [Acidobacteria bacterium]|nr:hypothetical protein [Acidobacteriota bacterium]
MSAETAHREEVGGLWDAVGELQLSFLRVHGLTPGMKLLDMGCGSLRGGVRFVAFLDPDHYFGIDSNPALLDAGYDVEIAARGLQPRLPRANLLQDDTFAARRFGVTFDMAVAVSLFSHLPWNSIRRCLAEVALVLPPGASFFASYFESPAEPPAATTWIQEPGGITTWIDRDPFHYRPADLAACAGGLPWRFERIGDWGHPRAQRMARFVRLAD